MKTLLVGLLLLSVRGLAHAQTDSQGGTIVFYSTDSSARPAAVPIVYSKDRQLGEVSKDHVVRVVVSPGVHYFGLKQNAPESEQLSVSIRGGQQIYLRVTTQGFFYGDAREAIAIMENLGRADPAGVTVVDASKTDWVSQPANVRVVTTPSTTITRQAPTSVAAEQSNPNATIFFYRPNDQRDSSPAPTIYALFFSGSRRLATLQKGEYFAIKVAPGQRAFSWVAAPARGQQVFINVSAGQSVFNQVQSGSILPIAEAKAAAITESLHPIDTARVFDASVLMPVPPLPFPLASGNRVATEPLGAPTSPRDRVPATPPTQGGDAEEYIEMLLSTEQDETETALNSLLSPSLTKADLNKVLDESVERRDGRIANLEDEFAENSSMRMMVGEIVNHLHSRNEFMQAYKNYWEQVDLWLAIGYASPELIFDSFEYECRQAANATPGSTAVINCEADRAKAELAAREARAAAAGKRAAAVWSSIVGEEKRLTRKLDENGLECRTSLQQYNDKLLNSMK